ncbi:hypothetical protein [Micromonospora sp. NPDC093277]|uniref:hypothetical protein n=1 Tax=Micromonospora sp. NPDC093277 TaxID=3364291 RepID=UPI003803BF06
MVTRRSLLGAAALALVPVSPSRSTPVAVWTPDAGAITTYRIEGSRASVALREGDAGAVLLHVARRWHYEIAALDTGEGGGVEGYRSGRTAKAAYESHYLSGTAVALHPRAYPIGGSESLWPHQEAIVRDILVDCEGTIAWGGDLKPASAGHFHVAAAPGDKVLARVAARLSPAAQTKSRTQRAGAVSDPAIPSRRGRALLLPRAR